MITKEIADRIYVWKKILHGIALLITAMSMSLPTKRPKKHGKATLNIKRSSTDFLPSMGLRPMTG